VFVRKLRTPIIPGVVATVVLVVVAAAAVQAGSGSPTRARNDLGPSLRGAVAEPVAGLRAGAPPAAIDPALFGGLEYRNIGPSQGGRVTAVEGIPDEPSTFYMGATGGGVWKTTDYGQTWDNISDGFFETGSIGAIRIAPSDPDTIYVGTGSDGIRSNVIIGNGVYKSTDAGETWTHIGLDGVGQIGRMAVDPDDPDTVYVGAIGDPFGPGPDRGVYKTTDGGQTWENVLSISEEIGIYGLTLEPGDPDVVYASAWRAERKPWTIISGTTVEEGAGIYKSTDGGESWTQLTEGLPTGLVGKIDLSISAADPERVYALLEAPEPDEGLYVSDDAGASWELVNGDDDLMRRPFYYTNVDADPTDADVVYVMNEGFFKSEDGGETVDSRSTPHGDNHDMWINPSNPDIYIEANDGGANVTLNDGETWSTQFNQPTAEVYSADLSDAFPYSVCSGQQDDGAICVPNLPPGSHAAAGTTAWWQSVAGCETGPAVPKPGDPSTIYGNCKGEFSTYDFDTGVTRNYWVGAYYMYGHAPRDLPNRFQRSSPIEISPHNPDQLYFGSQFVYRTRNGGQRWQRISPDLTATPPGTQGISGEPITRDITGEEFYSTLYAIEESPLREGVIWVGSNDGPFHVTRNGGQSWTDITPPDLPDGGRVQNIEPSPHNAGTAYYATYRYLLDDFKPYVYKTDDFGRSWTLLTDGTNGIPADVPVRVVREDPERPGLLYAGTEHGMYISFDDGKNWQQFQLNLPYTPVTDIQLHQGDLVLSTMGRGFWILDDVSRLRQLTDPIAQSPRHLFTPGPVYRMDYPTSDGELAEAAEEEEEGGEALTAGGDSAALQLAPVDNPPGPEYPENGALIDYYLADEPAGDVRLEILDSQGNLVRAFSSEESDDPDPPLEEAGTPQIPKTAGAHRVVWDLRYHGPWDADPSDSGEDGPLAVPGRYQVRLVVGSSSQTRHFDVLIDPRLADTATSRADLREQWTHNRRIVNTLSDTKHLAADIGQAQENLEDETGAVAERARRQLGVLELTIINDPKEPSYPQQMLLAQVDYLYGMTNAADQRLGEDAFTRYGQVRGQVDRALDRFAAILDDCGEVCA
jgi:photosystem II stability/assembly factor-like uncharacterized protein